MVPLDFLPRDDHRRICESGEEKLGRRVGRRSALHRAVWTMACEHAGWPVGRTAAHLACDCCWVRGWGTAVRNRMKNEGSLTSWASESTGVVPSLMDGGSARLHTGGRADTAVH